MVMDKYNVGGVTVLAIFLFIFYGCRADAEVIYPSKLGAHGDGMTDDSKIFQQIFQKFKGRDLIIDGQGRSYRISGNLSAEVSSLVFRNTKVITGNAGGSQMNLRIVSNNVSFSGIDVTGDRSTSRKEIWKIFSTENGVKSIMPAVNELFFIESLDTGSVIDLNNIKVRNLHAQSAVLIRSLGKVNFKNIDFENLSNKGFHVYHINYDDSKKGGYTEVAKIKTRNTGILPEFYYVDNKRYARKDGHHMPQESFNCIVSFGKYKITDAQVIDYGSIGITSDRNENFVGENLHVSCSSSAAMSNNPSAGIWFECSENVVLKNSSIDISSRSKLDLVGDNSALHVFAENSHVTIDGLLIRSNAMNILNKGIRGSLSGENILEFSNVEVRGKYKQGGVYLAGMQKEPLSKIKLNNLSLENSNLFMYQVRDVGLTNIRGISGSEIITYLLPENPKSVGNLSIENSNLKKLNLTTGFENFRMDERSKMSLK